MNRDGERMTITLSFIKTGLAHFISQKAGVYVRGRRRKTAITTTSSLDHNMLCYLQNLTSLPHLLPRQGSLPPPSCLVVSLHSKVKLAIVVKGNPKALFSLATTTRYRGRHYSFSWIAPLYTWSILYNAGCWAKRHQVRFLESLVSLDLGLNPSLLAHWGTISPPYLDPNPQIEDWSLQDSLYLLWAMYI